MMKSYMYNEFVEDVMIKVYDNMFDMNRETYEYIYSLLEYYYNNIVIAKMSHNDVERKCYDSIENIHRIISYSNRIDIIEFMLLCDCINEINNYFDIQFQIEFDDYIDIDNTYMSFYDSNSYKRNRKRYSFYDFDYCTINITAYVAQYMQVYS